MQVKSDGYLFLTDFSWVEQPCDNFYFGMYTSFDGEGKSPKEFEIFKFYIDEAPEDAFEIFHIPNYLMFKAGYVGCPKTKIKVSNIWYDSQNKCHEVLLKNLDMVQLYFK